MSKYMQLTVTIRPYYQRDLEGTYPKLTRHLRHLDSDLADRSPSLYELVGQLDQLLYRLEGTPLREVLLRHSEKLRDLYKTKYLMSRKVVEALSYPCVNTGPKGGLLKKH